MASSPAGSDTHELASSQTTGSVDETAIVKATLKAADASGEYTEQSLRE